MLLMKNCSPNGLEVIEEAFYDVRGRQQLNINCYTRDQIYTLQLCAAVHRQE